MDQYDNNLSYTQRDIESVQVEDKPTKSKKPKILFYAFALSIFFTWFFAGKGIAFNASSSSSTTTPSNDSSWFSNIPFIGSTMHLIGTDYKKDEQIKKDRINILFLGIGGKNHDGAYLTDTMMLASLQISTKKVALLSIPRDMAVPIAGRGIQKINHIDSYAEESQPGSGGETTSKTFGELFNIPIDYYVRVDFEAFGKIIDDLGGVDVDVAKAFDDYAYPVDGKESDPDYLSRFRHLHFDAGMQHMDGNTALNYTRSRHGNNGEGSDFARARRQQLVIEAVRDKLLSSDMLKPSVLSGIISDLNDHVSTNLNVWDGVRIWKEFKDVKREDIINKVLDNSVGGMLIDTTGLDGSYLLSPKTGNYDEIKGFVQNILETDPLAVGKQEEFKSVVPDELPVVDVRNGTSKVGLATVSADKLEKGGFKISKVGNVSRKDFDTSIIYDLTYGEKITSLKLLKEKTGATISFGLPQWLIDDLAKENKVESTKKKQPDFILIIGRDQITQ
ncbi:MAG: LCP family protein [Candidatus Falkowbacteria bacterium]|nr:LCP family protein [Candidatus Falkowbacteria bacterium]